MSWDPQAQHPRYPVTNLERGTFGVQSLFDTYRLRWQIELLFKKWKSHANLRAFDTANPHIAEGLIWVSLCTVVVKRYWAHTVQWLMRAPVPTRKVTMRLHHVLQQILGALLHQRRRLHRAVKQALQYLASNAQRARPKQDGQTGRLKLALEHVFLRGA